MKQQKHSFLMSEHQIVEWITKQVRSDNLLLRRALIRGLRFAWRHRPIPGESSSKEAAAYPTGPYTVKYSSHLGDLLLWVPRLIDSYIIDDLTGRYGYSHITVDTGEADLPTGKPVMIEVTLGQVVERKFQDEYGDRAYARIPLVKTGLDVKAFVDCVISRLGEAYDTIEALSLGEMDDPAKQMCSGLASDCLPEPVQRKIADARRSGLLPRTSVSVHSPPGAEKTRVFISPNGFAQYYGAPKGRKLRGSNVLIEPHPMDAPSENLKINYRSKAIWFMAAAGILTAGILLYIIKFRRF